MFVFCLDSILTILKLKMLIAATLFLFAACLTSTHALPVTWDHNRAVACDFPGNDLSESLANRLTNADLNETRSALFRV